MKKITIAYIGGGSKNWAHKYFADLLLQDQVCGEIRLYDIDTVSAERNKIYFDKLVAQHKDVIKSEWECKVVSDIGRALMGVDFILISILPYSLENMAVDVHYAEKYGIYQSVGDTVGPGGYSRALRTIPTYRFFARMIKEYAPEAWVINYTNPMTMCVNTLYYEFPEIKCFGCCHEVFGTQKLLGKIINMYNTLSENGKKAFMAADVYGVKKDLRKKGKNFYNLNSFEKIDRHDIKVNVLAINHFTFLNKAEYNGQDIFPIYAAYIKLFHKRNEKTLSQWYLPTIVKRDRLCESVKYELFEKYGLIAAAGDRHLAEFMPYIYLTGKDVWKKGFKLTTVASRIRDDNKKRKYVKWVAKDKHAKVDIKQSGEEGVLQIIGLAGLKPITSNVNVLNHGQIPNLPMGTAVETNALFDANGVTVVDAGELKEDVAALVRVHAENQRDFVKAYIAHDRNALIEVFLRDPAVARIPREKGIQLFEEMVEKNKECLESWI